MDPVTAIGLLASVSQLIQGCNTVLTLIKTFKDGDKDLLEIVNHVSSFEEALKGFDRVLRSRQTRHHIAPEVIKAALEEGLSTIQNLQRQLAQIYKSDFSAVRRMKWVQNKSSLTKLQERLKAQNTMLQSFLALAHAETFLAVCSQHPQFLQVCSSVEEEDGADSDALSVQYSPSSEGSMLLSVSSASSLRRAAISTTASSVESSESSLRRPSLENPSSSSNQIVGYMARLEVGQGTSVEGSPMDSPEIRRACRYDCYCECHAPNTNVSKRGSSRSDATKRRCSDPNCQRGAPTAETVAMPYTLFRRALSHVMCSQSVKIRYDLSTFRTVMEGCDAMRYVKHGNLEKLKLCIETGEATLWDTAPDGWSLLHTAAYSRQLPIVKYLLGLGADTEVTDVGTRKPADLAILKSLGSDATHVEQEIVEAFSQTDDYVNDFDFTPIHIAVLGIYETSDVECPMLEQLIQFVDDANNAPAGTDWAKWKLKYRKRSPLFGQIIEIFRASAYGKSKKYKVIHNLLDQKDKKYCWTPLHWASSAGLTDKMKILIDYGADPFLLSNLDANILHAAVESRTLSGLVGALEVWRRSPRKLNINQANRWAETPLHMAACGSVECVKLLLEAGADPNVRQEDQQVPLHCAGLSTRGDFSREIVALLCQKDGLQINAQDVDGRPPIFDFLDDTECLQLLVDHGARLDSLDNSGKSIFHHACIQDESDALNMLLRLSSDSALATTNDQDGNSPLLLALRHRSVESARVLLGLNDVGDMVDQDGWAVVHHAANLGDADLLKAALKHSSFVHGMRTADGKTAEVVAMEAGNWCGEVKDLLRRYNSPT